jgi:hypothetical protein
MKFAILASMLSAAAAFAPASQGGMYGTIRETPWMPASLLLESIKPFSHSSEISGFYSLRILVFFGQLARLASP